jgi:hypothetical protein
VIFVIKNILTGKFVNAHARKIKKATVDDWDVSDLRTDERLRRERSDSPVSDTSDIPLAEVQRKLRRKRLRENSISDNDSPLTKLRKQVELKHSVKLPDIKTFLLRF